jgi:DNA polymerase-3 subunit delta'
MVEQNRLSHAMMFLGPEGSGGLSLARAFSQYLFCEKVNKPSIAGPSLFGDEPSQAVPLDSCGECLACKKASSMMHPDIHFSYPVIPEKPGDKPISADYIKEWREFIAAQPYGNLYDWLQFIKAENKQGNITSRECEEIMHKMSLKSFEAGYKILVMWMPEALGKEGNKLLKLIEEPPADTLFILVAENESLILPTILSRVQLISLPRLSHTEISTALVNREGVSEVKAAQAAMISEGNYREALNALQETEDNWDGMLADWMKSIVRTGPADQYKWIEAAARLGREKQKQFLLYVNHMLAHAIHIRTMGQQASSRESASGNDMAERLNKICSLEQQEAMIEEIDNSIYYIERNANAKILFHALTIRLYHIITNKTVILVN